MDARKRVGTRLRSSDEKGSNHARRRAMGDEPGGFRSWRLAVRHNLPSWHMSHQLTRPAVVAEAGMAAGLQGSKVGAAGRLGKVTALLCSRGCRSLLPHATCPKRCDTASILRGGLGGGGGECGGGGGDGGGGELQGWHCKTASV